jgi:hypothetical protein
MPIPSCTINGIDCRLDFQKDLSDNTYSGILNSQPPVLFSFSDSQFIPPIKESLQQLIRDAIRIYKDPDVK